MLGVVAKALKDQIFKNQGVRIIDDVHGISVYDKEHPVLVSSVEAPVLFNSRKADFFGEKLLNMVEEGVFLSDRIRLSMELFASSFFESNTHAKFLKLILAMESFLRPQERADMVKRHVDDLVALTENSELSILDKESIKGSLRWLYRDSINQSLAKLAEEHLDGKLYCELSAKNFIKECYSVRSKLVHTGKSGSGRRPLDTLTASLVSYVSDFLLAVIKSTEKGNTSSGFTAVFETAPVFSDLKRDSNSAAQ